MHGLKSLLKLLALGTIALLCIHGAALASTTAYQPVPTIAALAGYSQSTLYAHVAENNGNYAYYSASVSAAFAPQNQNCPLGLYGYPAAIDGYWLVTVTGAGHTNDCWVLQRSASFITTAQMLSAYGPTTKPPELLYTGGRDTVSDHGGGWWRYDATDTTTADNGGTIRVDTNGHRFFLLPTQTPTTALFGAFESNNGTPTLNDTPLQNALDWQFTSCTDGRWGRTLGVVGHINYTLTKSYPSTASSVCLGMRILGMGGSNEASSLTMIGTVAGTPALDWSPNKLFTLENVSVFGLGLASTACYNGRVANADGSQGEGNGETHLIGAACNTNGNINSVAGMVIQDGDLPVIDKNSTVFGPAGSSGIQAAYYVGNTLPESTIAGGVGIPQAGSSSTITLTAGASSTDNIFAGYPMKVCSTHTASNSCSGTTQIAVVASYDGTSKILTPTAPWTNFTPTTSSLYVIYAIKSPRHPLAGMSNSNGSTQYSIGGTVGGAVVHTGGSGVIFNDAYVASYGNPAAGLIEDRGHICGGGLNNVTGTVNWESYGLVSSFALAKNGGIDGVNLSGRFAGPAAPTDTDGLFRANAADLAANICGAAGFGGITIHSDNVIGAQSLLDVVTLPYLKADVIGASNLGSVTSIGTLEINSNISGAVLTSLATTGRSNSIPIIPRAAYRTGVTDIVAATAALKTTQSNYSTVGDGSFHIRSRFTIPAHFLEDAGANVGEHLKCHWAGTVAAGTAIKFEVTDGSYSAMSGSGTVTSTSWSADLYFSSYGGVSLGWEALLRDAGNATLLFDTIVPLEGAISPASLITVNLWSNSSTTNDTPDAVIFPSCGQ